MSVSGFSVTPKLITESDVAVVVDADYNSVDVELSTYIGGWHVVTPSVTIDNLNANTYYQRSLSVVVANDEDSTIRATVGKTFDFTTLAHELEDLVFTQRPGRSKYNSTPISVNFTNVDGYIVKSLIAIDQNEVEYFLNVNSSTGLNSVNYNFNFEYNVRCFDKIIRIMGYTHTVVNAVNFDSITTTFYLENPISFEVNMNTFGGIAPIFAIDLLVNGEHSYSGYLPGETLTYTLVFSEDISWINVEYVFAHGDSPVYGFEIYGNTLSFKSDYILLTGISLVNFVGYFSDVFQSGSDHLAISHDSFRDDMGDGYWWPPVNPII
jgi:hypothetical protein